MTQREPRAHAAIIWAECDLSRRVLEKNGTSRVRIILLRKED
jgi:hypothetical protein